MAILGEITLMNKRLSRKSSLRNPTIRPDLYGLACPAKKTPPKPGFRGLFVHRGGLGRRQQFFQLIQGRQRIARA